MGPGRASCLIWRVLMNYVSFSVGTYVSFGVLLEEGVYDLGARVRSVVPDLRALLAAQSLGLLTMPDDCATIDFRSSEFTYLPVVPNPTKILCVGLNYEDHRAETGRAATDHPAIFTRFSDTLVGHRASVLLPPVSKALDYEGELAVVIGKAGYRVAEDEASSLIAGYSVFNDVTVRDWQRHTPQFTPGKNFLGTGAFGPSLVTGLELTDLQGKRLETRLNGQVVQSADLDDMIFSIPQIIAYVSGFTPLSPGDVIATGTPGGVGFKRDPPLYMQEGDIIEVGIEGIGRLLNVVGIEGKAHSQS